MRYAGNGIAERMPSLVSSVEWIVALHENLLFGENGRFVNGIGAICVILLCLTGAVIWWPGINNWRRALTVNWRSLFARFSWDLHSALRTEARKRLAWVRTADDRNAMADRRP